MEKGMLQHLSHSDHNPVFIPFQRRTASSDKVAKAVSPLNKKKKSNVRDEEPLQ